MAKKKTYSKIIGLKKSLKNVAVTYGIPAALYLLNGMTEWMPNGAALSATPLVGALIYFGNNYYKYKDM